MRDNDIKIETPAGIASAKQNAEEQILHAYFASVFETSPAIDGFATWLLAAIGATAALIIANIKNIAAIIAVDDIKLGLVFLVIAALFGFVEKFLAINMQTTTAQELKLRTILQKLSINGRNECTSPDASIDKNLELQKIIDMVKVTDAFKEAHPWYKRRQFNKNMAPDDALKIRLRRYYRQVLYTVLEFVGFLLFIIISILSI